MKRGMKATLGSMFGAVGEVADAIKVTASALKHFAGAAENVASANEVVARNWREISEAQAEYRLRKRRLKLSKKIAELEAE
jgi:hypothetical protein